MLTEETHTHTHTHKKTPQGVLGRTLKPCYSLESSGLGAGQKWPHAPFHKQMFLSPCGNFLKYDWAFFVFFFLSKRYTVDVRSAPFVTLLTGMRLIFGAWAQHSRLEVGTDKGHWPLPSAARCDADVIGPERQTKLIKEETRGGGGSGVREEVGGFTGYMGYAS